jgi:hypothetical protein
MDKIFKEIMAKNLMKKLIQEAHRALSNVKKEKHAKMHHKHIPKT